MKRLFQRVERAFRQTRDKNFIGFDKYQKRGAFHWEEMKHNEDYKAKLDAIISFTQRDDLCLDIGCGDGAYMYAISQRCKGVVGVDADYDAIRVGSEKLEENRVANARCIQAAISQLSASTIDASLLSSPDLHSAYKQAQGEFDLVYSMDVIEHLPDPQELLRTAVQMAKPNGLIIIGTPLFVSEELVSPYHVKEFTQEELRALISPHLSIKEEIILPSLRKDGKIYDRGFYISVGTPTA